MNSKNFEKLFLTVLLFLLCLCFTASCENIDIKTVTSQEDSEATVTPEGTATKTVEDGIRILSQNDENGRIIEESVEMYSNGISVSVIYKKHYEYNEDGSIKSLAYENGDKYVYSYNNAGKVSSICKNGTALTEYSYDENGYLIKEHNFEIQKTYEYLYDENGNIMGKKVFILKNTDNIFEEQAYEYNNGKLSYVKGGEITYNSLGNPILYSNGRNYSFVWRENGRILDSVVCDETTISYEYGAYDQRSIKNVNGVRYEYKWSGMKLTELSIKKENTDAAVLNFTYSEIGVPVMLSYNGQQYYYKVNGLGEVEEIFTQQGSVGRYYYDAWGRIIKTESYSENDIINLNPIRYKGYIYDTETGLYYLHTRYYDAEIGRRINADGYSPNNKEGYMYAENDPVANVDSTMEVRQPVCNQLHLYTEKGGPVAGKINVVFKPNISNPVFQIENSYRITDVNHQRAVLEYIMESDLYVQEIYCRTIESMLIEWKAHNHVYAASPNERCRHVDFDKNDEGVSYSDFWKRAVKDYGVELG